MARTSSLYGETACSQRATGLKGSTVTEKLDPDALEQRFPSLGVTLPCAAQVGGGGGDKSTDPTTDCHVIDRLSHWNYVLWHVGLQLRELRRRGKLSLVRVAYMGMGGERQRLRSHDARFLFQVLLAKHSCVEGADIDDLLIEGSGLGEYRERIVWTLQKNTSLRKLTISSLFVEYKFIRDDLFDAISTMTNLRELAVTGHAPMPDVVLDAICSVLVDTMALVTLSIAGLVLDAASAHSLVSALRNNGTVEDLSVHSSILNTYQKSGISRFCRFVSTSGLSSLSVEGVIDDPASTYNCIKFIIIPLLMGRNDVTKLRLTGFRLPTECADMLAAVVSRQEGCLESLDISGCSWVAKSSPARQRDSKATGGHQPDQSASAEPTCPWLNSYDSTAKVELSFLALAFSGLRPRDLRALFDTARTVQSLGVISLRNVPLYDLKQVCSLIRQASLNGRVKLEDTYVVDPSTLTELREFPDALSKVAIEPPAGESTKLFADMVQIACTWYQVTVLHLVLTQSVVYDVPMFRALSKYLSAANSLKTLSIISSDRSDLSRTLRSARQPCSVLLDETLKNKNIESLLLNGLRLGEANLRFLVGQVVASKRLADFAFGSCDPTENHAFMQLLSEKFHHNKIITQLRLLQSAEGVEYEWFVVEDVISRNVGYATCAANFLALKDHSPRCEAAVGVVSVTHVLKTKVEELTESKARESR
ncbi:hypothetical protein HPB50_024789 [Hyalomma asiaticum]|uniref:Uncharacterized protein n=1 Tax=Hyalomma asiaticum TaxID=266040 RepID=A0ACB7TBC2_HYAAI|nr:hypothetical protein HPB50_024789 [Hyalomma asiaticum]